MANAIVSKTGIPRGKGSDRYKYVAFLTKEEKKAALRGETVLVRCPWAQHCAATDHKLVVPYRTCNGTQKFGHKNYFLDPNPAEIAESQRRYERELDAISDRARHLESLTSEQRQELFTRPYP
tara:strand:+ start:3347 stop:3715 length:369 start_codon:yes stop_codon:yes gene_type:complete